MHMRMMLKATCLLASACLIQAQTLTIANVAIVDVNSGNILSPQNIVIEGNKIARIESPGGGSRGNANANTIDGTGKFAMPGLCDMHIHAYFSNDARKFPIGDNITLPLYVANGVTCVRDLGSNLNAVKAARTRIAAHQLDGPRMFITGPMLDGAKTPYQAATPLATRRQAREAVSNLKQQGVDFIKVHLLPSKEVFQEIAAASKDEGMIFGGHVPDSVTAQEAIDAGMGYIEHLSRVAEGKQQLVDTIVRQQVWQCPTLKLAKSQRQMALTNTLVQAGAKMVAGTDSPAGKNLCPGSSLHDELELMNQAGLTTLQTLQAATKNAAESVGMLCQMGTLDAGKLADLVMLDQNPLQDIRNVRTISAVVADGQFYSRQKLDSILTRADQLVQCNPQGRLAGRDLSGAAGPSSQPAQASSSQSVQASSASQPEWVWDEAARKCRYWDSASNEWVWQRGLNSEWLCLTDIVGTAAIDTTGDASGCRMCWHIRCLALCVRKDVIVGAKWIILAVTFVIRFHQFFDLIPTRQPSTHSNESANREIDSEQTNERHRAALTEPAEDDIPAGYLPGFLVDEFQNLSCRLLETSELIECGCGTRDHITKRCRTTASASPDEKHSIDAASMWGRYILRREGYRPESSLAGATLVSDVSKALEPSAMRCNKALRVKWVDAEHLEDSTQDSDPTKYHTIIPGGFGVRGTEGMIKAASWARTKRIPTLVMSWHASGRE
ncbi:Uncharacterized protein TPAR_07309 [Tolypocladium paradoxum]|uniref:Amidohydrolase-related domain-containing protein n=1 Tax=Tolypocladium paradoxum TaxID=94208 RepID=A0A2S4KQK8_9HYPO|nr:Uncharacterized protein TPAR_07309 [Tolypocladium paradoxum]